MKLLYLPIIVILLASTSTMAAQLPPGETSPPPDAAPNPGCVAQLNDSSCRPDKFPQHNPDPAIQEPTVPKHHDKIIMPPGSKSGHISIDCRYGSSKCFCTNKMASLKARRLGLRYIHTHGYSDRVLISGTRRGNAIELMISREQGCPVISGR